MPDPVNVRLNVIGDAKGAVRAFEQTTQAAQRTETAVNKVAGQGGTGGGIAALIAKASAFATELGVVVAGVQVAGQAYDKVFNTAGKVAAATNQFFNAPSRQGAQQAFQSEALARSGSFNEIGGTVGGLNVIGTNIGRAAASLGHLITTGRTTPFKDFGRETEAVQTFKDYLNKDPARAADLLAGGDLGQFEYLRPRLQKMYTDFTTTAAAGAAYTARLHPQSPAPASVVTFNTAILGSTQDALAVIQRAQRNNGQATVITAPRAP